MDTFDRRLAAILIVLSSLFLLPAVFFPFELWDDAALYHGSPEAIERWFKTAGLGYFLPYYSTLMAWEGGGPRLLSSAISVFTFIIGFFLIFFCVCRFKVFESLDAFWIALLSAVAPLNFSKPLLTPSVYNTSFLLFLMSMVFLILWEEKRRVSLRVTSLVLFFAAFMTSSMLPMAILIPIAFFLLDRSGKSEISATSGWIVKLLLRRMDFICLPFFAFAVRLKFLAPSGNYEGYNHIDFSSFLGIFYRFFFWVGRHIEASLKHAFDMVVMYDYIFLIVFLFSLFLLYFFLRDYSERSLADMRSTAHLTVSSALVFFAVSAYLAVGKYPYLYDWETRHQLTLQIVSGHWLWSFIRCFLPLRWFDVLMAVCVALLGSVTFFSYLGMQRDAHLQRALVVKVADHADAAENSMIAVVDPLVKDRLFNRVLRSYEWIDVNARTGTDRRAVQSFRLDAVISPSALSERFARLCPYATKIDDHYGLSDWYPDGRVMVLHPQLRRDVADYDVWWTVSRTWQKYIDEVSYDASLENEFIISNAVILEPVEVFCP